MRSNAAAPRLRIGLVAFVVLLGFLLLILRLVYWQVVGRGSLMSDQFGAVLIEQRPKDRGSILDRGGEPLAYDVYRWEVWAEPWRIEAEDAPRLALDLAGALGPDLLTTPGQLAELLASGQDHTVMLARRLPQAVGEAIAAWDDRWGIELRPIPVRFYPQHSLGAHLLGFVNDEPSAYYGVEQYYDDYLRAVDGSFFRAEAATLAAYRQLPLAWQEQLPSLTGQDLVLTIDRRIQYTVEQILADAIGRYKANSGTIVVMDPNDGALLAMASLPAYDPNRYGLTNDTVLADPAISRQYEPGSVFKIVTMAAGIDAGLVTPDTIITDTETMEVGGRIIQNWDRRGHGQVDMHRVLVSSLNIGAAQVALMLEESLFYQYVRRFGFGQLTEVDLSNESSGTVKVPGDPQWSRSDLATNAFGQGIAVTPLQMATATAVIANGGYLVRPHVVDSLVYHGRVIRPDRSPVRRVIKPETAAQIRDMMIEVVQEGALRAGVLNYTVAGKTGTAQVAIDGSYHPTLTIASFVGFAPAVDPRFVVLVKLDQPKVSPWAVDTAAPTFAALSERLLYLLHVPPDSLASGAP